METGKSDVAWHDLTEAQDDVFVDTSNPVARVRIHAHVHVAVLVVWKYFFSIQPDSPLPYLAALHHVSALGRRRFHFKSHVEPLLIKYKICRVE